ncbi:hypothetical protein BRC96_05385 [Halobacteriales archaeon QS_6_64_34]|nr:MAG: hypothetical protein BRC96_05385 [Halobacteriales archaeon QS_6_64_34]
MMENQSTAEKYLRLIRAYTDGHKTASEFMREYLSEFKEENIDKSDAEFEILNNLFFAAEVYCDDPELRGKHDIGERQLFKEAAYARKELKELLQECEGTDSKESPGQP